MQQTFDSPFPLTCFSVLKETKEIRKQFLFVEITYGGITVYFGKVFVYIPVVPIEKNDILSVKIYSEDKKERSSNLLKVLQFQSNRIIILENKDLSFAKPLDKAATICYNSA